VSTFTNAEPSPAKLICICRRISAGEGTGPITLLRDFDQPFTFEIRFSTKQYRLEFYDTSSPENWRLLNPDLVILCYDISRRSTLMNMKSQVGFHLQLLLMLSFYLIIITFSPLCPDMVAGMLHDGAHLATNSVSVDKRS
jgi:hypothetical protein